MDDGAEVSILQNTSHLAGVPECEEEKLRKQLQFISLKLQLISNPTFNPSEVATSPCLDWCDQCATAMFCNRGINHAFGSCQGTPGRG